MYLIEIYRDKSRIEGDGLFSSEFIPRGTIVYFYGSNDGFIPKDDFQFLSDDTKELFYKYGVEDEGGNKLIKEDKINHSCDANILSMFVDGICCDIAIRDIQVDEELTIDYGLFYSAFPWYMECRCKSAFCRKIFGSGLSIDIQTQNLWHARISEAIRHLLEVKQNLFFIDDEKAKGLTLAIKTKLNPKIYPYIKFSLISDK
jgi:uncharacterized protein